jgi:hypothetical protein
MSILETPRIYFKGNISWDPVTTNNYAMTNPPGPVAKEGFAYDEDASLSVYNKSPVDTAAEVAAFRAAAIEGVNPTTGSWNPDGTYRSRFFDTAISGVDTGSGLVTNDPFVGAPVNFVGMLVDCEPYGAYSSQLFFDTMSFGIPGGCQIFGRRVTRVQDRYINFGANPQNNMIAGIASVMWQTVFPKDGGLELYAHNSPALAALANALSDDDVAGLMVRWTTYRTVYYDDDTLTNATADDVAQALKAKLQLGGFQPNPARSLLVGTVGLWRRGEPVHEPAGRTLVATLATLPNTPPVPKKAPPYIFGSVFAHVQPDRLVLDMSNAVPWASRAPEKLNLGMLNVLAADPAPAVAIASVATLDFSQYNQAAYEATSGIVTIPLGSSGGNLLHGMDLSIRMATGPTLVQEQPLRAIATSGNLYTEQNLPTTLGVQLYNRGVKGGAGVQINVSCLDGNVTFDQTFTTDGSGMIFVTLDTSKGNVYGLTFNPGSSTAIGQNFNTLTDTYAYVRVLPADAQLATMPPTWDNVFNNVLANWKAMAPCMDNWLDLEDEAQVRAYGPLIKRLTDRAAFEQFRYMPITRDLTPGMRTLLYTFLDQPGEQGVATLKATSIARGPDYEVNKLDFAALSRAQRSGSET